MTKRESAGNWWESHLETPTIVVALVFLMSLIIPNAYGLTTQNKEVFGGFQVILWLLFSSEYLIRVLLAKNRWRFLKRHPIDFIIVFLPPLHFLQVVKVLALTAYFVRKARNLFIKRNMWFLLTMAPLVLMVSSAFMYAAEAKVKGSNIRTFGDSVWWAVTTMSTVGYGDKYPTTNTGKVIATLTIIVGVSLIGMLTAEIAVIFIGTREQEETREKKNHDILMGKLESMEKELRDLRNPDNYKSGKGSKD